MLAAEAMRLAAYEALVPTERLADADPIWPTMAGDRVFDSQAIQIEDLSAGADFTPSIALYTDDSRSVRRGDGARSTIGFATATLTVVCELSVMASDDNGAFADAMASTDPKARLVLGALCSQVRQTLVRGPTSEAFRRIVKSIDEIRMDQFALPEMGLRWMRSTMSFSCSIADDEFTDDGGLPQPIRRLMETLPANSHALAKLTELAALFRATDRDALDAIIFSTTGDPVADGPEGSA
jgi:hypothetical protein